MGRISAPFGIKGWIRIQPFTDGAEALRQYATTWWIGEAANWQQYEVQQAQVQGRDVVAKLAGCDDRDAALCFKGRVVAVSRDAFPPVEKGAFYWVDLVGLKVRNTEGVEFGVVTSMLATGANDVLVVNAVVPAGAARGAERLIPFIADVVKQVDMEARVIEVDWGADY